MKKNSYALTKRGHATLHDKNTAAVARRVFGQSRLVVLEVRIESANVSSSPMYNLAPLALTRTTRWLLEFGHLALKKIGSVRAQSQQS